jgi:hypothetical protein
MTRVKASNELLQILNGFDADSFDGFQQAMSHGFIISLSRRSCLRSRQVISFQEREQKLV